MTIEHVHHWLIATPDGVECPAYCECGQSRMFDSGFDDKKIGWRNCKKCGGAYNSAVHKEGCA